MDFWLLSSCLLWSPPWTPACSWSATLLLPDQWWRVVCLPCSHLNWHHKAQCAIPSHIQQPPCMHQPRGTHCLTLYCLVRTAQVAVSFDDYSWNVEMTSLHSEWACRGTGQQKLGSLLLILLLPTPLCIHLRMCCVALIGINLCPWESESGRKNLMSPLRLLTRYWNMTKLSGCRWKGLAFHFLLAWSSKLIPADNWYL